VALAARHGLPAVYEFREFAAAGGLMSLWNEPCRRIPSIRRVRRADSQGARPADLPVLQPTTFELVINLKTAKALDLEVPPMLLARADEVIE